MEKKIEIVLELGALGFELENLTCYDMKLNQFTALDIPYCNKGRDELLFLTIPCTLPNLEL